MIITDNTEIKVTNKFTHKSNTATAALIIGTDYPPKYIIEPVMKDAYKQCELMKSDVLSGEILEPITVLSSACFCIAVCCFLDMPNACRSLADAVFTTFSLSIPSSGMRTDVVKTKAIIKEFVVMILKEHENLFNEMAEKLGVL